MSVITLLTFLHGAAATLCVHIALDHSTICDQWHLACPIAKLAMAHGPGIFFTWQLAMLQAQNTRVDNLLIMHALRRLYRRISRQGRECALLTSHQCLAVLQSADDAAAWPVWHSWT